MVAPKPQPIAPLSPCGGRGVRCSWPRRDRRVHLVFSPAGMLTSSHWRAGAVSRFFPALETTSPISAKGGSRSPPSVSPPKAGGSARGVGTGGLRGRSISPSVVGPSPPAFLPTFSPLLCPRPQPSGVSRPRLLAHVPTSGQARRAGGTLKKGLHAQSTFRFADQRLPPLQEQHPWGAEPQNSSRLQDRP